MKLREYQSDIVKQVFEKDDNVLVVLPTGGGKTVIAKEIIKNCKEQVLFIVPKLELIKQSASTFDEEVDVIWSSNTIINHNHITVASKQTLLHRNLQKYFNAPITVIVDEVHIGLQSLQSCLKDVAVKRIIGLTATPERNDGKSFVLREYCNEKFEKDSVYDYAVFHRVINKWNIQELQKLGYLSPLKVIFNPEAQRLSKIKPKHKFDDELDSDVIMDELGDSFFAFVKKAKEFKGKPTLIFTPDLASLKVVLDTVNKSGLLYKGIDGGMGVEERSVILAELKDGKIDGVVNCGVLTTGFDMPKVKQCILIRNIKSKSLLFQIVGRFIRPYEGETAVIYDFAGSCYNFATASVPNVFEAPADWKYEGFEVKDVDEKEAKLTEDLKNCLGEANITWTEYLKDPISTLLNSLLAYKENFEMNLYNSTESEKKRLQNSFNKVVTQEVAKQADAVKQQVLKNADAIIKAEIQNQTAKIGLNPLKNWFETSGFEWFRANFAHILSEHKYNGAEKVAYREYITALHVAGDNDDMLAEVSRKYSALIDKLTQIQIHVVNMLPFDGLLTELNTNPNSYKEFCKMYDQRTRWWLLNYKTPDEYARKALA